MNRNCPKFNGRSGIAINECVVEVQACMRAQHLSVSDQSFFLFDHLKGETREGGACSSVDKSKHSEMLKLQQKELTQLTKNVAQLGELVFVVILPYVGNVSNTAIL